MINRIWTEQHEPLVFVFRGIGGQPILASLLLEPDTGFPHRKLALTGGREANQRHHRYFIFVSVKYLHFSLFGLS